MKYMGSKRSMLSNGLGEVISEEVIGCSRFVDLFSGSAAVAWHVSTRWDVPVVACDLQQYAVCLASSVLGRTKPLRSIKLLESWIERAGDKVQADPYFSLFSMLQSKIATGQFGVDLVREAREISNLEDCGPITQAYGGHYFSPLQALWLDSLRMTLPTERSHHSLALASLISAGSRLAAAPGHTAQPFQPTPTGGPFLAKSWQREALPAVKMGICEISRYTAMKRGSALKADAIAFAKKLRDGDLVFVDPPYSAVHYSRFYHVLETIADGGFVDVTGVGRYPTLAKRPQSVFSIKTQSKRGISELFEAISVTGASAIVTFPDGAASNGLSGSEIEELAADKFRIKRKMVSGKFSTLGGNKSNREARHRSSELILSLSPR